MFFEGPLRHSMGSDLCGGRSRHRVCRRCVNCRGAREAEDAGTEALHQYDDTQRRTHDVVGSLRKDYRSATPVSYCSRIWESSSDGGLIVSGDRTNFLTFASAYAGKMNWVTHEKMH